MEAVRSPAAWFAGMAARLSQQRCVQSLCELVITLALEVTGCRHARIDLDGAAKVGVAKAGVAKVGVAKGGARRQLEGVAETSAALNRPAGGAELQLPLGSGVPAQTPLGTLTLYSESERGFDATTTEYAAILAQHASIALAALLEEEHLRVSISTRTAIGQAQGILMERHGISADKAFAVLRRYSQDTNIKLLDVAERIVATRRLPESQ